MAKVRKWGAREIAYLRTVFQDVGGVVQWAPGTRNSGKVAGSLDNTGYRVICIQIRGRRVFLKAHRVMWALYNSTVPDVLDHIDRNRDNNCIENLRESDPKSNAGNKGQYMNNKSGMSGVKLRESGNYQVTHNCKCYGTYASLDEAIAVKLGLMKD